MMRYMGVGRTWTAPEADAAFDEALVHWKKHGFGWTAALDAETREWLGLFVLNHIGDRFPDLRTDDVSLGWWIVRSAWGNGYAVEGAERVRDEAFARLGVPRLFALIHPENARSVRVAEKIGMRIDSQTVDRDGEPLLIYGVGRYELPGQA
jgi:RimJ/RimL family protein N-acetyltransferase